MCVYCVPDGKLLTAASPLSPAPALWMRTLHSERLGSMSKVTQLEGGGAGIKIQVCLSSSLLPEPLTSRVLWKTFGMKTARQVHTHQLSPLRTTSQEESWSASLPAQPLCHCGSILKADVTSLLKPSPSPRQHKCPFLLG